MRAPLVCRAWLLTLLVAGIGGCASQRKHLTSQTGDVDQSVAETSVAEVTGVEHSEAAATDRSSPVSPAAFQSETPAESGLTLDELEQLALRNNPAIRQTEAAVSKAAGIRDQVGLRPNPQVGYFAEEIGNEGAGGLHGAFVSQMFVRGDKLDWNEQVIGHDVRALMWLADARRHRVRTDIRLRFYNALSAQQRLKLAREFREIAERGVQVAQERKEARVGSVPDILQSEIQLSEVDLLIQSARFEFDAAWNELAAIAGVPHLAATELIGNLDVAEADDDLETVYASIASRSPQLMAASARVDRARANIERQGVQAIPNVTARLGVGHDDATGDEFANVQLSLPLPVHNQNEGNIRAAYAEYCEATQNLERLRMQIRRDLAGVMREYQVARATVARYEETILPKAIETLSLMQEAQAAGQYNFLRLLTARRMYFDVSLEYVAARTNLAKAHARIEGLLLTGGLSDVDSFAADDGPRGQALNLQ